MHPTIKAIEATDGVAYVTKHGSDVRVVFDHRASTEALQAVRELTGCHGELAATQEHHPSVSFPEDDVLDGGGAWDE